MIGENIYGLGICRGGGGGGLYLFISFIFLSFAGLIIINHYYSFSYFANTWHPFAEVGLDFIIQYTCSNNNTHY